MIDLSTSSPSTCSGNPIVKDSSCLVNTFTQKAIFTVQNTDPVNDKYLILGTRGMAGVDDLFLNDLFYGKNFADDALFKVQGQSNGAAFQGFNYRAANEGYILNSITIRNVPVTSALYTNPFWYVKYSVNPNAIAPSPLAIYGDCDTCTPINSTYVNMTFKSLENVPIDSMNAVGILIPAKGADPAVAPVYTVEVDIKQMATYKMYSQSL